MRTHYCGLVDETLIEQTVTLCGWADTRRDHGGVIFIDLRDHEGLVQVVVQPDNQAAFAARATDAWRQMLDTLAGALAETDSITLNRS